MILNRAARSVHRVGHLIKLVGEEVAVQIERHRRGLVSDMRVIQLLGRLAVLGG
jgi:hypothetical protein